MKEKKILEFLKGEDYQKELDRLQKEGWKLVSGEPIEKVIVKVIGKRFTLEK